VSRFRQNATAAFCSTRPLKRRFSRPGVICVDRAASRSAAIKRGANPALLLCELLANADPQRYERAALRWLERFISERLPPLTEVALAASALAELRHGQPYTGVEALKRLLRQG
jgi:hypothetical protein